jgi:hypothetical protein
MRLPFLTNQYNETTEGFEHCSQCFDDIIPGGAVPGTSVYIALNSIVYHSDRGLMCSESCKMCGQISLSHSRVRCCTTHNSKLEGFTNQNRGYLKEAKGGSTKI